MMVGYVENGVQTKLPAKSECLKIQTNSWNFLKLTVSEKDEACQNCQNIDAYIDDRKVGSFEGRFTTRGFGGVLAENGNNNIAEFRNFDIAPIVPSFTGNNK